MIERPSFHRSSAPRVGELGCTLTTRTVREPIWMLAAGIELVSMGKRFLDTLSSGAAVQMPLRPPLLMLLAPVETTW